ncbi:MAG TPA: ComF family protein [Leptospiraceae bacterium]|nr:ComF family protein [Leptospiraceae bacterium]HMW04563.1 ComF family protein [Leptospiraceae bacterium]HMX33442.1 ComF family protein [Leptospiraceae bacterium]HMY30749.1 ComF family protein [Leptospiraceae bacterium]HMZ64327.1 ComF family protein [Leptospiraceae bacterium]
MTEKTFTKLIHLFYPLDCSICGDTDLLASKISICRKCYRSETKSQNPNLENLCEKCKTKINASECPYCKSRNVFFNQLYYLREKNNFETELIRKIKFGNNPYLTNYFRIGLGKRIKILKNNSYKNIIQIPSNQKTLRTRPFAVSKPISDYLMKKLKLEVIKPIVKTSSELQSGKSFRDRFLHAQTAFSVIAKYKNQLNGNYLLVDDVFTTGATVNEISKLLLINGAKSVDILVLAKGKV